MSELDTERDLTYPRVALKVDMITVVGCEAGMGVGTEAATGAVV